MNKKINYIIWGFIFLSIASFVFLLDDKNINILAINSAEANPDYICIKNVSNQPCTITSCTWWIGTQRTCYWTTITQVAYKSWRTACAEWWTAVKVSDWWMQPRSWRYTADFNYNSKSCTIVQTDTTPPTGDPEATYE